MKIVLLAGASSIHTVRWANGLAARGMDVHLVSLHSPTQPFDSAITLHQLPFGVPWGYIAAAPYLQRLFKAIRPDLLNAHYATGYGLLARLGGYSPLLLSVWGSDVYDFPGKSPLHRKLLRGNLKSATQIASTSHCMARKTREVLPTAVIAITPFGVDETLFHPVPGTERRCGITIGTVKTLAPEYGIDTLIKAFARLYKAGAEGVAREITLEITGDGPQRAELELLASTLGVAPAVTFHGAVAHDQVPAMLARLDVFVALSQTESFGVAAVEAAMCGLPVLVSDAEGFVEVVDDGVTGFVVPRSSPEAAAQALDRLVTSQPLRQRMGNAGRERALALYTWGKSLDTMIETYKQTIEMASPVADRGAQ